MKGIESPDIDTTMAVRQSGAAVESFSSFQTIRSLPGSANAAFAFGSHALRPASGAQGDSYFETDRNYLYYYDGTKWLYEAGVNVGTDATRAAITVSVNDNGALFYTTDTGALWRVEGGAWVNKFVTISATTAFKVGANQVLNARKTGWGSPSGTLSRAAYAAYAGQTVSNPPTQGEMQALDDAVKLLSRTVAALLTDLHGATSGHGVIGT
jgi:hypothetical protein